MPVQRKTFVWLKKTGAGAHKKDESIPALVALRDILQIAGSAREARKILRAKEFFVDGKAVCDEAFPIGLMDVVSIPKTNSYYRVLARKGKLAFTPIAAEEAKQKLCRVMNKTPVKNGRIQLNLHDGRNCLIEKEEDQFSVGDTLKIALPTQKIEGFIKLEKGAQCYIFKGKHAGSTAVLEKIIEYPYGTPSDAVLKNEKGEELITLKDYLFVVDKNFKI
jgi:small subunit ribosomal protein S4e